MNAQPRDPLPAQHRVHADVQRTDSQSSRFSAAARRLDLTQPAVSLQVRQLEARLGVRLVERVGRTARPTAAGAELLEHARRIEAAVATALDRMATH